MDRLVAATLKDGLLPPVVMEFPGITAGGGFSGMSGESSSFRHGFFHQTVKMVEIIVGNGDVLHASECNHQDLFRGAATSCGTMGLVTLLCVQLIEAKAFVSLRYIKLHSIEGAVERIRLEQDDETLDFIDGIFFSETSGVLCLGTLTDVHPTNLELKRFSMPWDNWFYIHVEELSATRDCWVELIPIEDYLFRYDRGAFWMGKYTYRYFAIPLNRFTRWAFDRYTHTRMMYHALHRSSLSNQYIIQDVVIPYQRSHEFLSYLNDNFRNYPVWICPLQVPSGSESSPSGLLVPRCRQEEEKGNGMMLNFGVWGPGPNDSHEVVSWNKAFERKVRSLGGWKWLYGHQYYDERQFWEMYDKQRHDELRQKYDVSHLPSLYDKIKVKVPPVKQIKGGLLLRIIAFLWSIWPLAGLYGWWQCIVSEEYLLPKETKVLRGR